MLATLSLTAHIFPSDILDRLTPNPSLHIQSPHKCLTGPGSAGVLDRIQSCSRSRVGPQNIAQLEKSFREHFPSPRTFLLRLEAPKQDDLEDVQPVCILSEISLSIYTVPGVKYLPNGTAAR